MSGLALWAALAGGTFLILMWICSCESSKHREGGGVPLRQARQEVDSEVRGLKVQEGKVPAPLSSSSAPSCLQEWRGLNKKKKKKKENKHTRMNVQDKNQGMEGGEGFFL